MVGYICRLIGGRCFPDPVRTELQRLVPLLVDQRLLKLQDQYVFSGGRTGESPGCLPATFCLGTGDVAVISAGTIAVHKANAIKQTVFIIGPSITSIFIREPAPHDFIRAIVKLQRQQVNAFVTGGGIQPTCK